ncbi:MAG: doubled motif LPXTG anchor domain-containing protein [Lachnospiraceae bacterium]
MKRKGMGKRIAAIVLAITMSVSMAGFQTGIVKAEVAEGTTTVETPADASTVETSVAAEDSVADVESADETATDSTINEGNETNDEGSIGEETTDPVITDEDATGDVADEENADEETTGDVSEEDEIADGEEIADEELTPEELVAKLAAEEEARLAAEEEARLAAEKEAARIRAELLATSPEIISQYTQGNVTVNVQAPEGAFPGGTTVSIAPVYQTNDLVDAIDSVETTEDIVAFDITFYDIDGYEIQPRDGYTVNVSFELAAASELARDDATLQVYHIDDAQNATPVGAEIPSSSEGVEVSVEAESFSVYAITVVQDPVEVKDEYYLTVGQTMEITKSLGHLKTKDIQVSSDSNVEIVSKEIVEKFGNDHAQINIKAISADDATVTVNYQYYKGEKLVNWHLEEVWASDSVSFKVHVADPQEFVLAGESQEVNEVNIVLGGFTVDENNVENWFRKIFGKDPKEVIAVSYDNGEVVSAEVVGIKNGYSIFNAAWAEKAAVATVKLTLKDQAAGNTDTVHLAYDVFGIGGKQTTSFRVTVGATHTVTFDYDYERNDDTQLVENGSKAVKPEDPTRKGYVFLGWYKDDEKFDFDTPITADLTLTARWMEGYKAEFYLLKNVNVIPLENGSTQYPAKDYSAKDLENMVGVVSNTAFVSLGDEENITNLNLAEAFQPVQDAIVVKPEAEYLKTLKEDILKAQGCTEEFEKYEILWYVVKKAAGTYHVDGVVYDKTKNYRSLSYDANTADEVTVPAPIAYPKGTVVAVDSANPSRDGYTFTGWNTQSDGKGTSYQPGDPFTLDDNTILYAQWKKNKVNDVNFYIQLFTEVMDTEGNIKPRPVNLFSGSVAKSTMNETVDTTEKYAGAIDNVTVADQTIRDEWLGTADRIADCPTAEAIFENLRNDAKTKKHFNNEVDMLTADNYDIYWYVVKYHGDGWHVDGILLPKESTTPDSEDPNPTDPTPVAPTPTPDPEGPTPNPGPTPDPGTTEITDDETPLAPNPGDDVDDDKTVEPTESTDIDDEDVPLSDGTDIDDEDVPLADFPDEDDAEVTDILDEETPLSDNPMTGDSASVLWAIMAMLAAFGLTAVAVTGKRKREE